MGIYIKIMFKDKQLRKDFEEYIKNLEIVLFGDAGMDRSFENMIGRINKRLKTTHPCSTCKALFRIEDLQKVKNTELVKELVGLQAYPFQEIAYYYCPSHKVPYDRIQDGKYYKDNVEVFPFSVGKFKHIKKEKFRWSKNPVGDLKSELIKKK